MNVLCSTCVCQGGYLFDLKKKERRIPSNDWRWTIDEKKLEKIPPIPGYGRINFGIAANNGIHHCFFLYRYVHVEHERN
jgi:hypothetical protein